MTIEFPRSIALDEPERFHSVRLDNELVVFDGTAMHYHALNRCALEVWQRCDGKTSHSALAECLNQIGMPVSLETVDLAVAQLAEAGLLCAIEESERSRIGRRQLLRLGTAGAIGAGMLPIVQSITVPDAASAYTVNRTCCFNCPSGFCQPVDVASYSTKCTGIVYVCALGINPDYPGLLRDCIGFDCFF